MTYHVFFINDDYKDRKEPFAVSRITEKGECLTLMHRESRDEQAIFTSDSVEDCHLKIGGVYDEVSYKEFSTFCKKLKMSNLAEKLKQFTKKG